MEQRCTELLVASEPQKNMKGDNPCIVLLRKNTTICLRTTKKRGNNPDIALLMTLCLRTTQKQKVIITILPFYGRLGGGGGEALAGWNSIYTVNQYWLSGCTSIVSPADPDNIVSLSRLYSCHIHM